MHKKIQVEAVNVRYRHPGKTISKLNTKLQQTLFAGYPAQGTDSTTNQFFGSASDAGGSLGVTQVSNEIIYVDNTFSPDSVAPGATVEEVLTRIGNSFYATLRVDFFRNVWYDDLEAYFGEHYDPVNEAVVPRTVLIAPTIVTARYVVR